MRWTTRLRQALRSDAGQGLVEFALVTPILLLLVVAIIEFGRAWQMHETLTDAAREGARYSVLANNAITQQQVDSIIRFRLALSAMDTSLATVTFPAGFKTGIGNVTAVRITYPYQFRFLSSLIALSGAAPGGVVTLTTEFAMRNE